MSVWGGTARLDGVRVLLVKTCRKSAAPWRMLWGNVARV